MGKSRVRGKYGEWKIKAYAHQADDPSGETDCLTNGMKIQVVILL